MTQGSPVIAGQQNTATDITTISSGALVSYNLVGSSSGDGGGFFGGQRGVYCVGQASFGLQAYSYTSDGVRAYGASNGVQGVSSNVNASGVYGENSRGGWGTAGRTSGADRAGVLGDNTGSGFGVLGKSASGVGVQGTGNTGVLGEGNGSTGVGMLGQSDLGTGVAALGGAGIGVYASGERAPLRLAPSALPGAPASGFHERGELVLDANGDLYLCKASGTPGTWRMIG